MVYTAQFELKRNELSEDFKVEPQEIITEAPLTFTAITAVAKQVNQMLKDAEYFKVTAQVLLSPVVIIDKTRVDRKVYVTLTNVLDFYANQLLKKPIDCGKC